MNTLRSMVMALLAATPFLLQAQEICNNAIDDDFDGLVDINDTTDCVCNATIGGGGVQSIIPNPSFEDYDCLPVSYSQLDCASLWEQATSGTSDYFNELSYMPPGVVPQPLPDGGSVAGLIATQTYMEYLGACLTSPMLAGTEYSINMFVAGGSENGSLSQNCGVFYGPMDITIFGSPTCVPLPINTMLCPEPLGWIELGSVSYQADNTWQEVTITFTPTVDIAAMMIGPPCILTPDFNWNGQCDPYFWFDDLTLNESSLFGATITTSGTWCNDDLVLHGNPDALTTDFQWYQEGVAIIGENDSLLNLSALALDTGNYQFMASVDTACVIATIHIGPPVYPEPLITAVPMQGCAPLQVQFTNSTDPLLVDDSDWQFGDGGNSTQLNPNYTYDDPGVYDVTLEVTSPDGCVSDTTYEDLIEVFQVPIAQFTADTLEGCIGLQVQFTNTTDTLTGTCSWDFGDGGTSNQCDPLHTYNTAGLFDVELTVTSPNNCVDVTMQQQYINVHPNPAINFESDTIAGCIPLQIEFTNLTPFWQTDSVYWDFGNGTTSNEVNPTALYTEVGVYDIFFSVVDEVGCQSDTAVEHMITAYGPPVVSFTNFPDSGCYPLEVTFTNTTDPATTASCFWQFGDGGSSDICDAVHIYEDPGVYDVTLQVISPQNCEADTTYDDLITVFDHPTADFYFAPQPTDFFEPEISFFDSSSYDAISWQWSFGQDGVLGTSTEVNPVLEFPDHDMGLYPVMLVVENMHGCTDTIEKIVVIDGYFSVYVPNCFTPDGDGVNDGWRPIIFDQDVRGYHVRVFDRWGEEIWASTDPNKLWDGRVGDAAAKQEVYVWKLETRDAVDHVNRDFIGHVTLIR